jgi:hypothetical protein
MEEASVASLEVRPRADGGKSVRVVWREDGRKQSEKFAAGSSPLRDAQRFKALVEEAGDRWPRGWTPGLGFTLRPVRGVEPTPLLDFGLRYIDQLSIRPGQRKRYRAQLHLLASLELRKPTGSGTYRPFGRNVEDVTPEDVRLWLSRWDRALKTKANYHGLLYSVLQWATEDQHKIITVNPCARTAPSRKDIRAEQSEKTFLTEDEFLALLDSLRP